MTELQTALLAAAAGAGAGAVGSLAVDALRRRHEAARWYHENQLRLAGDALAAVQQLLAVLVTIAASPLDEAAVERHDNAEVSADFYAAHFRWTEAWHRLHLSSPARLTELVRDIDDEIVRLQRLAFGPERTREAFRPERRRIGELMANLIKQTRAGNIALIAKGPPLEITTVWRPDQIEPPPAPGRS